MLGEKEGSVSSAVETLAFEIAVVVCGEIDADCWCLRCNEKTKYFLLLMRRTNICKGKEMCNTI